VDQLIAARLDELQALPTGLSSAGFPYLPREGWLLLRDRMPLLFSAGDALLREVARRDEALADDANARRALKVVQQVVQTAAIAAPPDLWLLRLVLGSHASLGLTARLAQGEAIEPGRTTAEGKLLDSDRLASDLEFLRARGIVEAYGEQYRAAGHPRVLRMLREIEALPEGMPASPTGLWRRAFAGEELGGPQEQRLIDLGGALPARQAEEQNHWVATLEEIRLGWRLLPVVLALRAVERSLELDEGLALARGWSGATPPLERAAEGILQAAGWFRSAGAGGLEVSRLGARGFSRGPGPFGIIETYAPYFAHARERLLGIESDAWVQRGANVAASQDANTRSFAAANDALDAFCRDTGFNYHLFIEHAVGRGEATRIRMARSGVEGIRYVGADLEDAAIDAAEEEQRSGRLPADMLFVRQADIGEPALLARALESAGIDPRGGVMMVGNGFHEVRGQDRERMTAVFRGYAKMGLVLLFTEENALSVDDLRATAWNTYHAGFKYVHELSGQVLRPGTPRGPERGGHLMRASWEECALAGGYLLADQYATRTRTIYPYPTRDGHNPAVSRNHFFVPADLARELEFNLETTRA
jgi:hypothetical protein